MSCLCGDDDDDKELKSGKVIVEERSCTDLWCCLVFAAFWVGMIVVAVVGIKEGKPERLIYGVDSFGHQCGAKNDTGPDLSDSKKLYYLNAFDFLGDPRDIAYAKTICVDECPGSSRSCNINNLPCLDSTNYICPYHYFAADTVRANVPINNDPSRTWDVEWWSDLSSWANDTCTRTISSQIPSSISGAFGLNDTSSLTGGAYCGKYNQMTSAYPGDGPCYPIYVPTTSYLNRCFPKFSAETMSQVASVSGSAMDVLGEEKFAQAKDFFNDGTKQLDNYVMDLWKGIFILVIAGFLAGIVLSLVWMVILRYFAGVMTWTTVLAVNLLFIAATYLAWTKTGRISGVDYVGDFLSDLPDGQDPSEGSRKTWLYVAIAASAITGLLVLFTLLMIRRIAVAIACIKVASNAIGTMPSILIYPMLPFVATVCLFSWFVVVAGFLWSAGTLEEVRREASSSSSSTISLTGLYSGSADTSTPAPTVAAAVNDTIPCQYDDNCRYDLAWDRKLQYMFLYHIFGLLWTNQFIVGMSYVVVAGAIAEFYWAQGERDKMNYNPVLASMRRGIYYHMGSVALGSFIVAVIQFIRLILEYIDRKTKRLQQGNVAVRWLLCCAKYCVWYLEKIMKFINRNAYIMVAVKGTNYCASAMRAVYLLVANALRLLAVNVVGDSLIFLGKLCVAGGAGCIAFLMTGLDYYTNQTKHPETFLSSALLIIIVSMLAAYMVASVFFATYEMAIDTVLLSFCEDCSNNNGVPQYAPELLMRAIGQAEKFHKRKEEEEMRTMQVHPLPGAQQQQQQQQPEQDQYQGQQQQFMQR